MANARPINIIIAEMVADMKKICRNQKTPTTYRKKFVYAVPYIDALSCLSEPNENYGYDNGYGLIAYLVGNLGSYRGETAKRLKKELNDILKSRKY